MHHFLYYEHLRNNNNGTAMTTDRKTNLAAERESLRILKELSKEMGYRIETNDDGTEERLIRSDGTVALVARKFKRMES
jgi:hypothetical protein